MNPRGQWWRRHRHLSWVEHGREYRLGGVDLDTCLSTENGLTPAHFGENYPIKRPAQPSELAPVCVMLASDGASYVSGTMIGVTGRKPIL